MHLDYLDAPLISFFAKPLNRGFDTYSRFVWDRCDECDHRGTNIDKYVAF